MNIETKKLKIKKNDNRLKHYNEEFAFMSHIRSKSVHTQEISDSELENCISILKNINNRDKGLVNVNENLKELERKYL